MREMAEGLENGPRLTQPGPMLAVRSPSRRYGTVGAPDCEGVSVCNQMPDPVSRSQDD